MLVQVQHARIGTVPVTGVPVKLSASPGRIEHLGPDLGQDNDEVYRGMLGLSSAEIEQLQVDGVI